MRKRNNNGQVLKSAARDGDSDGPVARSAAPATEAAPAGPETSPSRPEAVVWGAVGGAEGAVCAVMGDRLGERYDETAHRYARGVP
ncbi:hypothetical protein KRMM14A1004_24460 [Krasilnikovia sp. MM14-A1004]